MELLHQLGDLVVQALPTVVIVFIFYLCMRALFFIPLQRAMDERDVAGHRDRGADPRE